MEQHAFTTRGEAIRHRILAPLGEHADQHDIEAIADLVLGDATQNYRQLVDVEEFWRICAEHRTG